MATTQRYVIRHLFSIFLPLLLTCIPATGQAEVELSITSGFLSGYTQYEIGAPVYPEGVSSLTHYPFSRLKFPIDAAVLKGTGRFVFSEKWQIDGSVATNITEETGDMKDYDWLHPEDPDQLDIYSESDTEMRALLIDIRGTYLFLDRISLNPHKETSAKFSMAMGLGFRYQYFDFAVFDTTQWNHVSNSEYMTASFYSGKTLTYEAEYQIPYVSVDFALKASPKLTLESRIDLSPFMQFRDWDHHLLTSRTQEADHGWNGHAVFTTFSGRYDLGSHWFAQADVQMGYLQSSGRATQSSGVSVKHKVKSRQSSAYVSIGYQF